MVIGCNGHVWIAPELREDADGGYNQDLEEVTAYYSPSPFHELTFALKFDVIF